MILDLFALRVRKLFYSLTTPRSRRALRLGVVATIDHRAALASLNPKLVIDIGANRGQFALFARDRWPNARIVSFEPLPDASNICKRVMENDTGFMLIRAAIANTRGVSVINITNEDDSSSLLPLGEHHKSLYRSTVVRQLQIETGRLRDFIEPAAFASSTLIKIDTQGFELEVLKGSEDLLPQVSYVYVELSFMELYTGQPLASEVIAYLHEHSFELVGVFNVTSDQTGTPIQADMLFVRRISG